MKRNILLITLIVLGLFVIGFSGSPETGLLQGKVLIGPIAPVEQPGQDTTLRCDIYALILKQVDIDCNAEENYVRYRVELAPGTYIVDINHIGIDYSDDVPKQVEIQSGATFRLDIDIDTGIR